MEPDLGTTNALLGIMAAVSVIEALALLALLAAGYGVYRRTMQAITRIEERQIAPVTARINTILDDVHAVTSVVGGAAGGAGAGVRTVLAWLLHRPRAGRRRAA